MQGAPHPPNFPPRIETSAGPLEDGDCLTAKEFLRRCEALPVRIRAELVQGIVRLEASTGSPEQAGAHNFVLDCLRSYAQATSGVETAENPIILLDRENVARPDGALRILPECGGQTKISGDNYLSGPPEFVVELVYSRGVSALRDKLGAYRQNGVREFLVWRVPESKADWFQFDKGEYVLNLPGPNNILSSHVLPGFALNLTALLDQERTALRSTLTSALNRPEHSAFVERLRARKNKGESVR